jgi:hypothetical protein
MSVPDRIDDAHVDPMIGALIDERYLIERRLGSGGMGIVYAAKHVKLGRAFAIKVLHAHLLSDPKIEQRFEREATLAGRLNHRNIIGVIDVGQMPDRRRYMVMELATGQELGSLCTAPMAATRVIALVRQLLEGLQHAHDAGLVHRDFKPENVIVETDAEGNETPRIVDFGIAILFDGATSDAAGERLTTTGLVLGTPEFMAPEQAIAAQIDHRVDLFAMGIVMYELLSGALPFEGSGAEVARANLLMDPPPMAERAPGLVVAPQLEAFVRRLMARNRDERPASARAARDELDAIERALTKPKTLPEVLVDPLGPTGAHAPIDEVVAPSRRAVPPWWIAAGGTLVVAAILALMLGRGHQDPPVPPPAVVTVDEHAKIAPPIDAPIVAPPAHDAARAPDAANVAPEKVVPRVPKVEPPPPKREVPPPKADPITRANLRQRYDAVQRLLKQHGSNAMWAEFNRIDPNQMLVFEDKTREAISILTHLENSSH